jgi:hypothetical protein
MKLDDEFKAALSRLSEKEKDKLIFRLIKHDLKLANRLRFELLQEYTVEESRGRIRDLVEKAMERLLDADPKFYSSMDLLWRIKDFISQINDHVATTKDKYGEIELPLFLINRALKVYLKKDLSQKSLYDNRLEQYLINKCMRMLLLIQKIDRDFWLDFNEDLREIQTAFSQTHKLMKLSIYNGFDVNWFNLEHLPEDLPVIYKEYRENGYFR